MDGKCSSLNRTADFKGIFICKISWTYYSQVLVLSIDKGYFLLNYLSTLPSVWTITRGQVSLGESIQYEKQEFPQREGNCLKVSRQHFVSALGLRMLGPTRVPCARCPLEGHRAEGRVRGVTTEFRVTSSVWWHYPEKTNRIEIAKRPLLSRRERKGVAVSFWVLHSQALASLTVRRARGALCLTPPLIGFPISAKEQISVKNMQNSFCSHGAKCVKRTLCLC